jgi:urease accessory protein
MLVITKRLPPDASLNIDFTLSLTAEERQRSRYQCKLDQGETVCLQLPRGTILENGDILAIVDSEKIIRVIAKPEAIMTVTAAKKLDLIKAAYHLGNRHIPLEITANYLRLSADSVLKTMLEQLNLQVIEELAPFNPEKGAYQHSH